MSRQFSENGDRRRASRVSAGQTVHLRIGAAYCTGRVVNLSTDGALIETLGYVSFYLLTTIVALPGIALFWLMLRRGLTTPDSMPSRSA